MTSADEAELHRLCDLIAGVDQTLAAASPAREGLQKAALALHLVFTQGSRSEIEQQYVAIGSPLSDAQRAHLTQHGIDPDR